MAEQKSGSDAAEKPKRTRRKRTAENPPAQTASACAETAGRGQDDGCGRLPKSAERTETVDLSRDGVIREYVAVYRRCMIEDPKTFDAKGALNALDQISRLLGLDTPIRAADVEGDRVILTLSSEVGERGD